MLNTQHKTYLNTGNKSLYSRVEYGGIRGYTVHTRTREYTDTRSLLINIFGKILHHIQNTIMKCFI